jgi:uncharacterized YccA/Bax inhibitor family protein
VLLAICMVVAILTWAWARNGGVASGAGYGVLLGAFLATGVMGLIIGLKPRTAPFLSPLHAAGEGAFLGIISYIVPLQFKGVGEGVVIQAMLLCFGILTALLLAYSAGLVRLGSTATKVVLVATGGVAIYYFGGWLLSMFGLPVIQLGWQGGIAGIGFSLFVVVLASLNLVLDFQFIQAGVVNKAPKYMEWYGAFGLLVTLVWLYIEVLRLLAKIQSRD